MLFKKINIHPCHFNLRELIEEIEKLKGKILFTDETPLVFWSDKEGSTDSKLFKQMSVELNFSHFVTGKDNGRKASIAERVICTLREMTILNQPSTRSQYLDEFMKSVSTYNQKW